jgi:hypothetical protein
MPTPTFPAVAAEASTSSTTERRATVRYACDAKTSCTPLAALQSDTGWEARVRDVSRIGLGLVLERRFEPGTIITVDLHPRILLVRVAHAKALPEGGWLLGCELIDPSAGEDLVCFTSA